MKKFLITVLATICFVCLGIAIGCSKEAEPKYYNLTFTRYDGVEYVCRDSAGNRVYSDAQVREGVTVNFTLEITHNDGLEDMQVFVNESELQADGEGVYSFVMNSDSTVTIGGLIPQSLVTFAARSASGNLDMRDARVEFTDENGEPLVEEGEELYISSGSELKFKAEVSVYYKREDCVVMANTTVLTADNDGVYTARINGDTVLTVSNLVQDEPFTSRADCGDGSRANPYKLSRPVDLYQLAGIINDSMNTDGFFQNAYYELTADIDFEGEQLFIIGDGSCSTAFFAGDFNGNGHTLKNYTISSERVDQSSYQTLYIPAVGVFGHVSPSTHGQPAIYNLNLDNYRVTADFSNVIGDNAELYVGSLAGYVIGADIAGVNATGGEIVATGSVNYFSYVGGIVGVLQSAYNSQNETRYYSLIRSCTTDVSVSAAGGHVYCGGGIAGYLICAEDRTNAFVLNCAAFGSVEGVMRAGGVVGMLDGYTSVINSYATGSVFAQCNLRNSDTVQTEFVYAYAGGVVGYANYETVVYDSFSKCTLGASAVSGTNFAKKDDIAGFAVEDGAVLIEAEGANILECYSGNQADPTDETFVYTTLGWDSEDWSLEGGKLIPNLELSEKTFTITVNYIGGTVGGQSNKTVTVDSQYIPMSYWYVSDGGFEQFVNGDNGRTFGYFFDQTLDKRVPYGFVPTKDITLYAGFAQYTDLVGEYHLKLENGSPIGSDVYFNLDADGVMTYRSGAVEIVSQYVYDGENIYFYYTDFAVFSPSATDSDTSSYHSFAGKLENGAITVYDVTYFPQTASIKLIAVKRDEAFAYGAYYADNAEYVFNYDLTGVRTENNVSTNFTYTISQDEVTIILADGSEITANVEEGKITQINGTSVNKTDIFAGTFEKSATSHKEYTFDGKGGWTSESFGYDAGGEKTGVTTTRGTYTEDGETLTATGEESFTATFNDDGYLVIDYTTYTETYYADESYAGSWVFYYQPEKINLEIYGMDFNGYGRALAVFAGGNERALTYERGTVDLGGSPRSGLRFYAETELFAQLYYDAAQNALVGEMYSLKFTRFNQVTFRITDDLYGAWVSDDSVLSEVTFNGQGNYDVSGSGEYPGVRGVATVGSRRLQYKLENATGKGSITDGATVYQIEYVEETGLIKVTVSGRTFNLEPRDDYYGAVYAGVTQSGVNTDKTYTFDGRGKLENGGKLTVSDGTEYTYKIEGDSVTVTKDTESGTLTVDVTSGFLCLNIGSVTEYLTYRTAFAGEWKIGGRDGGSMTVTQVKADGTASVTLSYLDIDNQTYTANYSVADGTLTFTVQINGADTILYIKGYGDATRGYELTLTRGTDEGNLICVPSDKVDELAGKEFTDANNGKLVFDGMGNARYGKGTAAYIYENGNAGTVYSYGFDVNGNARLMADGRTYLFVKAADGAYQNGADKYALKTPDSLYLITVRDLDNENTTYAFDGAGKVVCKVPGTSGDVLTVYSYEIIAGEDTNRVTLVFTGSDDKKYNVTLNKVVSDDVTSWNIHLEEQAQA